MTELDPPGTDARELIRAVQEIALARDLDTLTTVVKHAARQLSGADGVTFVLREDGHCHYVDEDAISPLWKGRRFPLETCISGWSMTHREIVVIEDIYQDPRIPHDAYRPTFVQSLAMIPVRAREPIAAIGAYWGRSHRATPREIELLRSVADTAAVALENIQLIAALREQVDHSTGLLEQFKHEVTRREAVEDQLRQSQRIEAIGRLAGGVAHDFNNLLSVILTYAGFVFEQLDESDPVREDIEEICKAGDRAAGLTRQLLAFSRKQVMEPQVINVNGVIGGIGKMLDRLLGEDIAVTVHPASDLGNVLVDPGQLEQVIMNLAVNARDAMPQGGKLTIETANVELDEDYAEDHLWVTPGSYVRVCVTDTGTGMSAQTQSRIFEPFFTTKERGKGTGLGLSTVYGIVKQSGGNIWVYSEPGQGTSFKIHLPRVDAPVVERPHARPSTPAPGNETILLVEDDPAVRKAAQRILESAGYRVMSAANGREALRSCEQSGARVDLVLTDVVMPEMSGRDLAEQLLQLNPQLKVLFTSGYTDNAIVHHGVLDAGTSFIGKPFSPASLTRKVREILDA